MERFSKLAKLATPAIAQQIAQLSSSIRRWIHLRAAGVTRLHITSDCCCDGSGPCNVRIIQLTSFLGCLRGTSVDLVVTHHCRSSRQLFRSQSASLMADLSRQLVALNVDCRHPSIRESLPLLASLQRLTELQLRLSAINSFPQDDLVLLGSLRGLQTLSECFHQLTALTLKEQQLGAKGGAVIIPSSLSKLVTLDLTGNQLRCLPADVTRLSCLTRLDLSRQQEWPKAEVDSNESCKTITDRFRRMQLNSSLMDIIRMPCIRQIALGQHDRVQTSGAMEAL
ncbi:hypothetical protein WJX73_001212 [Symbiochloris irregularis]|uniref:Uncharacterized protein n=1 Tax=Symbiochloris irregularis TaxID=706552 RepID=A0AAW1PUX7_9CHLO